MFGLLFLFRFSDWTLLFWFGVSVIISVWLFFIFFICFDPPNPPPPSFCLVLTFIESDDYYMSSIQLYSIWKFKLYSYVWYSATCLFICHIVQLRPKYFFFIWLSFTQSHHLINKNDRIKLGLCFHRPYTNTKIHEIQMNSSAHFVSGPSTDEIIHLTIHIRFWFNQVSYIISIARLSFTHFSGYVVNNAFPIDSFPEIQIQMNVSFFLWKQLVCNAHK